MTVDIARRWYATRGAGRGITQIWEPHVHRLLRGNLWHVRGTARDLVIDAGLGVTSLVAGVPQLLRRDPLLVLTHTHCDHVGAAHEFPERWAHREEADRLRAPAPVALRIGSLPADLRAVANALGPVATGMLLSALPSADFDPDRWRPIPAPATRTLRGGETIDLGDRSLCVLHLPGHSPGSVGLYDERHGILFSGDAVYEGVLVDDIEGADITAYKQTMQRLRDLDVQTVHPGHNASFGATTLDEICERYLANR